jgi:hypothetical protein
MPKTTDWRSQIIMKGSPYSSLHLFHLDRSTDENLTIPLSTYMKLILMGIQVHPVVLLMINSLYEFKLSK